MSSQDIKHKITELKRYLNLEVLVNPPPNLLDMMNQNTQRFEEILFGKLETEIQQDGIEIKGMTMGGELMMRKNVSSSILTNKRRNHIKKSNRKTKHNNGKKSNSKTKYNRNKKSYNLYLK